MHLLEEVIIDLVFGVIKYKILIRFIKDRVQMKGTAKLGQTLVTAAASVKDYATWHCRNKKQFPYS